MITAGVDGGSRAVKVVVPFLTSPNRTLAYLPCAEYTAQVSWSPPKRNSVCSARIAARSFPRALGKRYRHATPSS